MPDAHLSYYTDMKHGGDYFTFISQELPEIARSFLPLSGARKTYIAGISMGGYGAFKVALSYPERFTCAGSLSGVMDLAARITISRSGENRTALDMLVNCFGEELEIEESENDLFFLLDSAIAQGKKLPALFQCCGSEDSLIEGNRKFSRACRENRIPVHYEEGKGDHTWNYWDAMIQRFINWLP